MPLQLFHHSCIPATSKVHCSVPVSVTIASWWTCKTLPDVFSTTGNFLKTLQDSDLNVRRVALAMFNSAAHNKPSLIRDLLNTLLPSLYNETKVRRELIREVCHRFVPSAVRQQLCVCEAVSLSAGRLQLCFFSCLR